jgi:hypothetical protein
MAINHLLQFRIKSVFSLMALIAVCLGAWVYVKQTRLDRARQLAKQGVGVLSTSDAPSSLPKETRSAVPFVRPTLAEIYVLIGRDGSVHLDGPPLSLAEAKAEILKKRDATRAASINNIHLLFSGFDCSVSDLMRSSKGIDTAKSLMEFATNNGFASTGFLEANEIDERKRDLDPNGIVHAK